MMCSREADLIKPFILYDLNAASQFHCQKHQFFLGAECEPAGGAKAGAGMAMCFMRSQAGGAAWVCLLPSLEPLCADGS